MVSSNDKVVQSSGVEEAEGVLAELSSNGLAVPEDEVSSLSPEKLEEMIKAIRTEIKNKDYHFFMYVRNWKNVGTRTG